MANALRLWKRFTQGEEGASMVEYGLLIALISVVAIAAIILVGQYVNGAFTKVETDMGAAGITPVP